MSVFDDLVVQVVELTKSVVDKCGMQEVLEEQLELLKKLEDNYINKLHKNSQRKNLQKIEEDEDESLGNKPRKGSADLNSGKPKRKASKNLDEPVQIEKPTESETTVPKETNETESTLVESSGGTETSKSKKLSKQKSLEKSPIQQTEELEDKEIDVTEKRTKRNASTKASANINRQVNQNLTKKLRRPEYETETIQKDKVDGAKNSRNKKGREDINDKENKTNNLPVVQIKQEKISIPGDSVANLAPSMDTIIVKQERMDMPPPPKPAPSKTKRQTAKERATLQATEEKEQPVEESVTEPPVRSSRVRGKKKDDMAPPPALPAPRQTRASSRACPDDDFVMPPMPPPRETRPKRTRAKKVQSEMSDESSIMDSTSSVRRTKTDKDTGEDQSSISDSDSSKVGQESASGETRTRRTRNARASGAVTEPIDVNAKSRPKRTRRANAVEKVSMIPKEAEMVAEIAPAPAAVGETVHPKCGSHSPTLATKAKRFKKNAAGNDDGGGCERGGSGGGKRSLERSNDEHRNNIENATREIDRGTRVLRSSLDKVNNFTDTMTVNCQNQTVSIEPTDSESVSPVKKKMCLDETVVIDKGCRGSAGDQTVVIESDRTPPRCNVAMNQTVTLNSVQDEKVTNGDSSILTDDNSEIEQTPPHIASAPPKKDLPGSAVKERVQQFEEMSNARVTRTKTRAMSKQDDDEPTKEPVAAKAALFSSALLTKLKYMPQANSVRHMQPSSAVKPSRNNIVTTGVKSFLPSSMSKASAIARAREQADELRRDREDPQKKKEAMLDAKREEQRRSEMARGPFQSVETYAEENPGAEPTHLKISANTRLRREEKMAAAAAAREQAAAARQAAAEAAARDREQRALQMEQEKADRMREIEKKRLAAERKVQETEERRRAEDAAKIAKLEEEQRRAAELRRKNNEEAEKMKKEALAMEKEIAAARLHYQAKEKEEKRKKMIMKQRQEAEKASAALAAHVPAVHMADGFEFLCSDDSEDEDAKPKPTRVPPLWSRSKERWYQLSVQGKISPSLIDTLFSVGYHTPNLSEVFPAIDHRLLKRTSSAVWRTPPGKTLNTVKE